MRIFLAMLPLGICIFGSALYCQTMPISTAYVEFDYDPAYVYLFNGLSMLNGYRPNHIDHPGTPVQMLCAILILLSWCWQTITTFQVSSINTFVLSHPEELLAFVSHVLLLLNALATYNLGRVVYKVTHSLAAALAAQMPVLLLNAQFMRVMYVNGEALGIFGLQILIAVIVEEVLGSQEDTPRARAAPYLAGAMAALAVAAKITFAPIVLLLLCMRSLERRKTSIRSYVISLVVLLAPIWHRMWDVALGVFQIAAHSGQRGGGDRTIVLWSALPGRIGMLVDTYPITLLLLLTLAVVLPFIPIARDGAKKLTIPYPKVITLLRSVLLTCAIQLAMVLKHFGIHYAVPLVILCSPAIFAPAIVIHFSKRIWRVNAILSILLIVLGAVTFPRLYSTLIDVKRQSDRTQAELKLIAEAVGRFDQAVVIGAYRVRDQSYALSFAIGFVSAPFARKLGTSPGGPYLSYNRWTEMLFDPAHGWREVEYIGTLLRAGKTVLLLLPVDISISGLKTETLLQLKGRERLLRVECSNQTLER